jgi:hypothetical protein
MYILEDNVSEGETRTVVIDSVQSHFNYAIFFQTQEGEQQSETAVFKTTEQALEEMLVDIRLVNGT